MASSAFRAADFKVFEVKGFEARMAQIRERIRPKLEALGGQLAPAIARATATETFAHVAKHARRTVNPPDDTWVAFGPDLRGYKKHPHFKLAVSRNCVRFLFEIGPEHADKKKWAAAWRKSAAKLGPVLGQVKGLAFFEDEHDEEPGVMLADLGPEAFASIADVLTRKGDGQCVFGQAVAATEAAHWNDREYREAALATFRALAPLYRLK
jgi:uncharacterized protein YktB (UPF0637 family)